MAITYDAPSNTISTDVDPTTFEDIYDADVAGGWGVWDMLGNHQFLSDAYLEIADGGHVIDVGKSLYFSDGIAGANFARIIEVLDGGKITLGNLLNVTRKSSNQGCHIGFLETTFNKPTIYGNAGSEMYFYSTTFQGFRATLPGYIYNMRKGRVWNCDFDRWAIKPFAAIQDDIDIYNCVYHGGATALFGPDKTAIDKVYCMDGLFVMYYNVTSDVRASNIFGIGLTSGCLKTGAGFDSPGTATFLDCDLNTWGITWNAGSTGKAIRSHTFNLKVMDKDGNGIQGVWVELVNSQDIAVGGFPATTGPTGEISELELQRGYCEYPDNNLDTNFTLDYSPFVLTCSKSGYKTYRCKFTLDKAMDWQVCLTKVLDTNISKRVRIFTQ